MFEKIIETSTITDRWLSNVIPSMLDTKCVYQDGHTNSGFTFQNRRFVLVIVVSRFCSYYFCVFFPFLCQKVEIIMDEPSVWVPSLFNISNTKHRNAFAFDIDSVPFPELIFIQNWNRVARGKRFGSLTQWFSYFINFFSFLAIFRRSYVAIFVSEQSGLRHVAGYRSDIPATLHYNVSYGESTVRMVAVLTIRFYFPDFVWPVYCHVNPGGMITMFIRRNDRECLAVRWRNNGGLLVPLRECKFEQTAN